MEITTRVVRLISKENVMVDQLPCQLRLPGGNALAVLPGRALLCWRFEVSEHIRKDCRMLRCDQCRHFEHGAQECARTLTTVATGGVDDVAPEVAIDEAVAELTTKSSVVKPECDMQADEGVLSRAPEGDDMCEAWTGRRNEVEEETTAHEVAVAATDGERNE